MQPPTMVALSALILSKRGSVNHLSASDSQAKRPWVSRSQSDPNVLSCFARNPRPFGGYLWLVKTCLRLCVQQPKGFPHQWISERQRQGFLARRATITSTPPKTPKTSSPRHDHARVGDSTTVVSPTRGFAPFVPPPSTMPKTPPQKPLN